MKVLLSKKIVFIIYISFFTLLAQLANAAPQQLKVVGTQLQTLAGCAFRIVGVNICGLEWQANGMGPPSGAGGDIRLSITSAVNTWKSNVVRIPINQDFWFGYSDGYSNSSSTQNTTNMNNYRAIVAGAVTTASNLGCYVELDLHWSGNGNWGTSTTSKQQNMPDDNSTAFWLSVATIYANNPAVIFNLYNEPKDDTWAIWKNGGSSTSGFHTPGFQSLVNTVRGTGANNIIVVGGLGWAWDMTGVAANALTDNGSGYGIAYEAHIYDNKGGSNETQKIALWNTNVTTAITAGYCVIIGEFGSATNGSLDISGCTPFESDLLSWINGNNPKNYLYNAIAWCWNASASPKLFSDWTFTPTGCHGVQVKNWLAAITPANCASVSPTVTKTATQTYTPTRTYTIIVPTNTKTLTPMPTNTNTKTISPTLVIPSSTLTKTAVQTITVTNTDTPVYSPTQTITGTTPSETVTQTSTSIITTGATATITFTSTTMPTATISEQNNFKISNTMVYPNPCSSKDSDLNIKMSISKPASQIKVIIYTVAFRRILENDCGEVSVKDFTAIIQKDKIKNMASGIYYMVVQAKSVNGEKAVSKIQELILIK